MSSSTLAGALVEAQQKMPTLTKTAKAVYGKYVTLDKVIEATRPILNEHGLAIVQFPAVSELGPVLRTTLIHGATGEQITADAPLFLDQPNMQKLGAAITYARRYAWASACGIATDEDDDAQSVSPRKSSGGDGVGARRPSPPEGSAARTDGNRGSAADTGQRSPQAAGPEFTIGFGVHKGKTLAQVPADYLDWYLANGKFDDVKAAIRAFRGETSLDAEAEAIPF